MFWYKFDSPNEYSSISQFCMWLPVSMVNQYVLCRMAVNRLGLSEDIPTDIWQYILHLICITDPEYGSKNTETDIITPNQWRYIAANKYVCERIPISLTMMDVLRWCDIYNFTPQLQITSTTTNNTTLTQRNTLQPVTIFYTNHSVAWRPKNYFDMICCVCTIFAYPYGSKQQFRLPLSTDLILGIQKDTRIRNFKFIFNGSILDVFNPSEFTLRNVCQVKNIYDLNFIVVPLENTEVFWSFRDIFPLYSWTPFTEILLEIESDFPIDNIQILSCTLQPEIAKILVTESHSIYKLIEYNMGMCHPRLMGCQ